MHALNTVAQILALVSFVIFIWLVVLAFKRSVGWGLSVLFLSPISAALFARKYWDEVKLPFVVFASTFLASTAIGLYLFTAWGGLNFVTTIVTTISRSVSERRPITEEEDLEVKHSLLHFLENAAEIEENRQTIAAMKQLLEGKGRDTIDGDLDWDTRRAVVDGLVSGITVETSGTGNNKTAAITVSYNFSEPVHAVDISTAKISTCLTRR